MYFFFFFHTQLLDIWGGGRWDMNNRHKAKKNDDITYHCVIT